MNYVTVLFVAVLAVSAVPRLGMAATTVQLKNGMAALIIEKKDAASTELRLWVRGGSAHERSERTNVAHVIEHLMFSRYSAKELPYFTQAKTKAQVNANTRHLATVYTTSTRAEHLRFFLELEAKRLSSGPLVGKDDIAREVAVIRKEHPRTYSQLPYQLWRRFFQTGFPQSPLSWHTSGQPDHLDKIEPKDIAEFWQRVYQPQQTCLAIVSPLGEAQVAAWVTEAFKSWQPTAKAKLKDLTLGAGQGPLIEFSSKPGAAQAALLGYRIPDNAGLRPHEMDFLNHVFIRSQLNVTKQVLHYGKKKPWEAGELNYDYDWHSMKAIILSDQFHPQEFWQKTLTEIAARLNGLSTEELSQLYQEYYLDMQEKQLRTPALADWLGRQCGKHRSLATELKKKLENAQALKKKIKTVLVPKNMVMVVHGT